MLAILDATSNSFYSGCYMLSNRNAILSTKVTIYFFKYLDSKNTFKGYFICSNFLYIATAEKIF